MGAFAQYAYLRLFGASTHIDKERKTAMFQVKTDTFYKIIWPFSSDRHADLTDRFFVTFLSPIALTIGAGTESMMADTSLT
jgi:hypothetical protein